MIFNGTGWPTILMSLVVMIRGGREYDSQAYKIGLAGVINHKTVG